MTWKMEAPEWFQNPCEDNVYFAMMLLGKYVQRKEETEKELKKKTLRDIERKKKSKEYKIRERERE